GGNCDLLGGVLLRVLLLLGKCGPGKGHRKEEREGKFVHERSFPGEVGRSSDIAVRPHAGKPNQRHWGGNCRGALGVSGRLCRRISAMAERSAECSRNALKTRAKMRHCGAKLHALSR